jgi:hypothetical protein
LEESRYARAVQFQLEAADPERTKDKLLVTSIALVSCVDPADPERRLRIAVGN